MPPVRALAAILFADAVGYSRLMGADEEGTHERVQAHFRELFDPKIAEHTGHVVNKMGDGILAQFLSVVEAVRCAVEIQRLMLDREAGIPEERRIRFRIGINLGDVIVEDDNIFGDDVNLAARLEGVAEAGGICVSDGVHQVVRDKLPYEFEDIGEQTLKNIARPIRAFAMSAAAIATTPLVPVTDLARAVVKTASSLPQEFVLQYMRVYQVTPYTVDGTLIDKGIAKTKTVSDPSSGRTHTETISTYIFAIDNGTHYPVKFTNFELPFVTGVRVTFLLFSTPDGKERFFSIYNHSERKWRQLPFDKKIDLSTRAERRLFAILATVWILIFLVVFYWFKEYPKVVALLWVSLGLGALVFMVRNFLRRERLKRRMKRLQEYVQIHLT
jgi:class 3 adenylate cyclase